MSKIGGAGSRYSRDSDSAHDGSGNGGGVETCCAKSEEKGRTAVEKSRGGEAEGGRTQRDVRRQLKERQGESRAKPASRPGVNADRENRKGAGGRKRAKRTRQETGAREKDGEETGLRVASGWRGTGKIGENRARLGFAMTNGRRGHSARRSYRSKRDYHVGLSVECLSRPGHLIRPQRGSFVFLVFQTRSLLPPATASESSRATPYFPFVRAIYRPVSPLPFLFFFRVFLYLHRLL